MDWVIRTCQCRFISYNKRTPPVGGVHNEGDYACVGRRVYWKSLCLPPQYCCEPKTTLKSLNKNKERKCREIK